MTNDLEQEFLKHYSTARMAFITNSTEVDEYLGIAAQQIASHLPLAYVPLSDIHNLTNQTEYQMAFNLSTITPGLTPIIGGKIFMLNSDDEIQIWDQYSNLTVSMNTWLNYSASNISIVT